VFACHPVVALRNAGLSTASRDQRRQAAYAGVEELRKFLDVQFSSPALGVILTGARLVDRQIPDRATWIAGWQRVRHKMQTDRKYVAMLCDELPSALAKYDAGNWAAIFSDPVIRRLILAGVK
jgi:hypothetical protein